jgi:RNA polymerase sigma-70 factor (ECF subfamily)
MGDSQVTGRGFARHDAARREMRSAIGARTGFRCSTASDGSPEALRLTRLAVERAKDGDEEALRFLYVRYSDNIYGYVRSIVRDDHEAEDVTQHVFAKLLTSIGKYSDRGVPFLAWLLRLARNVAIDHLRSNRSTPVEEVLSQGGEQKLDEALEDAMTVREALATLPLDQREVVFLRHVVGLSPGEIADRMGKTEGSIHGLHHRGRRSLQQELSRRALAPSAPAKQAAKTQVRVLAAA